ncbi:two pore domain potassium channel family protein [Aquimarina sp. MMG016]|uniref:two pore domain potassium channel family protein n=1 Tax=Aquimarina sp. MMG016 TaxID=2822690 RepID=UPI001B3A4B2E|nr:two pore domain potassium channel family protein [Aquimarina sp. MMG016]MBQ4821677.1 two pore domain potassium channel family protein [Aquimarina sp. MMG016]
MIENLYKVRFPIFLTIQLAILFGAIIIPSNVFEYRILSILYLFNLLAGILMILKHKKLTIFLISLCITLVIIFIISIGYEQEPYFNRLLRLFIYFAFNLVVTWNLILQVWRATEVNKNVILGLISGYIALGFLSFFLLLSIELTHPGAFQGALLDNNNIEMLSESLLYYAYITLLTIGYGEITPAVSLAQKASILIGLIGQFYLVIVTAVVVGKYIAGTKRR